MANREIFYFPDWSLFAFFIATVLGVHFANGALGPQPGDAKLSLEEAFDPKTNDSLPNSSLKQCRISASHTTVPSTAQPPPPRGPPQTRHQADCGCRAIRGKGKGPCD